jgi:hypothetical protein
MSNNLEPDFYVNIAFSEATHNDVNNNQVNLNKANTVSEQIELKQNKDSSKQDADTFVYMEGGFGWVVGIYFQV